MNSSLFLHIKLLGDVMRGFLATVLFMLLSITAFAQQAGVSFTLGFPMQEFKDNMSRTGFGGSVEALLIKTGPASMGLNIGYLNYGNESRRERFSTTIPDVTVDVHRTNNILNFHLLFQIAPPLMTFTPYAEGLFGGSYIFTETRIDSRDEEVASSTNFDDFAWSYGAGGGFLIHVYSDPGAEIADIYLDFKVRYLFGSEAEYLKPGSIRLENGHAVYSVEKSKTDLLTASIGVAVSLNPLF
jgi:hypothetical protein